MAHFWIDDGPPPIDLGRPVVEQAGVRLLVPPGWEIRARHARADDAGARAFPVLHAATIPLPVERGDYGGGVVEGLGVDDVFISLVEFGEEAVDTALFPRVERIPGTIVPEDFHPSQLQRSLPGQAGVQKFFTYRDRAFCLYVVVGAFARRALVAPKVRTLLAGLSVDDPPQ